MTLDAIMASLPALSFGENAPLNLARFRSLCDGRDPLATGPLARKWQDLETQLRNAAAAARGKSEHARPATGCSIYYKNRVTACFAETDPAKRQDMLDKVWWDAAGELADPSAPLGEGALAAYAVRLSIAERRRAADAAKGMEAFDAMTARASKK